MDCESCLSEGGDVRAGPADAAPARLHCAPGPRHRGDADSAFVDCITTRHAPEPFAQLSFDSIMVTRGELVPMPRTLGSST